MARALRPGQGLRTSFGPGGRHCMKSRDETEEERLRRKKKTLVAMLKEKKISQWYETGEQERLWYHLSSTMDAHGDVCFIPSCSPSCVFYHHELRDVPPTKGDAQSCLRIVPCGSDVRCRHYAPRRALLDWTNNSSRSTE